MGERDGEESLRTRSARAVAEGKQRSVLPSGDLLHAEHLYEIGDMDRAKVLFQRIVAEGHRRRAPVAAYYLGLILRQRGDRAGAKESFQGAVASGRPRVAGPAAKELAEILLEEDDPGFVDVCRLNLGHHDKELAAHAAFMVGLFHMEDDPVAARPYLQRAIDTGHPAWAPEAALQLGLALSRQGDVAGAVPLMRRASESLVASSKAEALVWLAEHSDDDIATAVSRLREAVAVDDPQWTAQAACLLGHKLLQCNDSDGARAAFQAGVEADAPDWSSLSMLGLGLIHKHHRDIDGARSWFRKAAASGEPIAARLAEEYLSELSS